MKIVVYVLLAFYFATLGCGKRQDQSRADRVDTRSAAALHQESALSFTDEEQRLIDSYRSGLAELASKSQLADTLLTFYDRGAFFARRIDPENIQIITPPKSDTSFVVCPEVGERATLVKGQGSVAARFMTGGRTMLLSNNAFSGLIRGYFLAHELVHAQDAVLRGERESEPLSPEWLIGEMHAANAMYYVLNQYTGGEWRRIVLESTRERWAYSDSLGHSPFTYTFGINRSDSVRVASLFLKLTPDDLQCFLTQLVMDANLYGIQERSKGNHELLVEHSYGFLRTFYEEYGAPQ